MKKLLFLAASLSWSAFASAQATICGSPRTKFGICSSYSGEPIIAPIFDEARLLYNIDTLVSAKRAGRAGLVSATGRTVVPCEFDAVEDGAQIGTTVGFVRAKTGDLLSLWNVHSGRKIIEGRFDFARAILPDLLAARAKGSSELEFFNENGQSLFKIAGQTAWPGFDDATMQIVGEDPKAPGAFFFKNGQPVFPEKFKNGQWTDGAFVVVAEFSANRTAARSAILTVAGETVLPMDSVFIRPDFDRRFFVYTVRKEGKPQKMGVFDAENRRWVFPMDEGFIARVGSKPTAASAYFSSTKHQLFDADGSLIAEGFMTDMLRPKRICADLFKDEHQPARYFTAVKNSTEQGLFAADGRMIVPMAYSSFDYASEAHPIIAQKSTRYGDPNPVYRAFDLKTGQKLFDSDFDELLFTQNPRRFIARKGDRYGIVEVGKEAAARFDFDRLTAFPHLLFWMRKGGKQHIVRPDGSLDAALVFDEIFLPGREHAEKFNAQKKTSARLIALGRTRERPSGFVYIDDRYQKTFIEDPTMGEMPPPPGEEALIEEVVVIEAPAPMLEGQPRSVKTFDLFEVDERPSFIGGRQAFADFVSKEMVVPPSAKEKGLRGLVLVKAPIEADGAIADNELTLVQKSDSESLDQEALRLVMLMPRWSPAKIKGQPVRSRVVIPIQF